MSCGHAFVIGIVSGLLCGLAVTFFLDVSLMEAVWRSLVLAAAGGCMGFLLACLDEAIRALASTSDDGSRKQQS